MAEAFPPVTLSGGEESLRREACKLRVRQRGDGASY